MTLERVCIVPPHHRLLLVGTRTSSGRCLHFHGKAFTHPDSGAGSGEEGVTRKKKRRDMCNIFNNQDKFTK